MKTFFKENNKPLIHCKKITDYKKKKKTENTDKINI